jgi:hypothetical protein
VQSAAATHPKRIRRRRRRASGKSTSALGTGLSAVRGRPAVNVTLSPLKFVEKVHDQLHLSQIAGARRSMSRSPSCGTGVGPRDALDHLDHLVRRISVVLRVGDEFLGFAQHFALLRRADHGDPSTAAKLQQPLVTEYVHRSQHGVLVHAENGGDVFDQRQTIAGTSLTFGNGSTNIGSNLIVQRDGTESVHFHEFHSTSHYRTIGPAWKEVEQFVLATTSITVRHGKRTHALNGIERSRPYQHQNDVVTESKESRCGAFARAERQADLREVLDYRHHVFPLKSELPRLRQEVSGLRPDDAAFGFA